MDKKKASQKYDDAVASGHGAVLMKDESDDFYEINIGNILPTQRAKIELHLLQPLKTVGGSYEFQFPKAFVPTFEEEKTFKTKFSLKFSLSSSQTISNVCHPESCTVAKQTANNVVLELANSDAIEALLGDRSKFITILYRTLNMEEPRMLFQECSIPRDGGGKDDQFVTLLTQFLPTFETKQPQDGAPYDIQFMDDVDDMDELELDGGFEQRFNQEKLNFYFVVDRSGSMSYPPTKIETTK